MDLGNTIARANRRFRGEPTPEKESLVPDDGAIEEVEAIFCSSDDENYYTPKTLRSEHGGKALDFNGVALDEDKLNQDREKKIIEVRSSL